MKFISVGFFALTLFLASAEEQNKRLPCAVYFSQTLRHFLTELENVTEVSQSLSQFVELLNGLQTNQFLENLVKMYHTLTTIREQQQVIQLLKKQMLDNSHKLEEYPEIIPRTKVDIELKLSETQNQLSSVKETLELCQATAKCCTPFGRSTGIHRIIMPQLGAVSVRCDGNLPLAGPGWIVFQRRYDLSLDFHRNWTEYGQGFGNLSGEFFLGLNKVHLLTNTQQYEVAMLTEYNNLRDSFTNGKTFFFSYNNFKIGSESEKYMVNNLGLLNNKMMYKDWFISTWHKNFSTYDQNNLETYGVNCAEEDGAWWYKWCTGTNLFGRHSQEKIRLGYYDEDWLNFEDLKSMQMMLRPVKSSYMVLD